MTQTLSEIQPTALARNRDTVDLGDGAPSLLRASVWAGVIGLGLYALFGRSKAQGSRQPDGLTELAVEARRIQRRVDQRRAQQRRRRR